MSILIIGANEVSARIANTLLAENINVLIVDNDPKCIQFIDKYKNINVKRLEEIDESYLKECLNSSYETLLALTNDDIFNISIATLAKELGFNLVGALMSSDWGIKKSNSIREKLDIDLVVNKNIEVSKTIKQIVSEKKFMRFDSFAKGEIETFTYLVGSDPQFKDLKVKDIKGLEDLLIVAIIRGSAVLIPGGETTVLKGDKLYFMGLSENIRRFNLYHNELIENRENIKITILGQGALTETLMQELKDESFDIKLITESEKFANRMKKQLSHLIVKANYKSRDDLEFENIRESQYTIVSTGNQEENIASALLLRKVGAKGIIVNIDNPEYGGIFDDLQIMSCLNSFFVVANSILRDIGKKRDLSVYIMFGGKAEIAEVVLNKSLDLLGKPIKDIGLEPGIIIGGVVKASGEALVPKGETVLEEGDRVVVFCLNEKREELLKFIDYRKTGNFFSELINLY